MQQQSFAGQLMSMAILMFVVWLMGYAACRMVNRQGWYVARTRRLLRSLRRLLRAAWRRWRTQIVWFLIGAVSMLYLLNHIVNSGPPPP